MGVYWDRPGDCVKFDNVLQSSHKILVFIEVAILWLYKKEENKKERRRLSAKHQKNTVIYMQYCIQFVVHENAIG